MPFATRLGLFFALAVFATATARAEDLNALLARMRSYSGPVWQAHLTSTSFVSLANDDAEMHSESQNVRFATYECTENLCAGTYFDGERLFDININGTTLPESDGSDPYLRGERTVASLAFLDPAFTDNGGQIVDDGFAAISGVRYRSLLVSSGDATPMQVFVDPQTGKVRYLRDVNGDATFEYLDYRRVAGSYTLPFLVMRNGAVLERYHTRGSTREDFVAPHGPRPTFVGAAVAVPTDPTRTIPVFACSIGGIHTTCLLDSGNSGLSISRELATTLHAQAIGSFQVRGLGNYSTDVVRVGALRVGNATWGPSNYVVLNDIHRFGYDVVLGADVLASTTISLDPIAHTIAFGAPAPPGGTGVHIVFANFVPVVIVQLGRLGAQLALDTGDESNINLAYDFYQEHRGLFDATEQRNVAGVGGTSVELIGTIPQVRIGNLSIDKQRIGATQSLRGTAYGHLGAAFLANFDVVIDYASGLVYFAPVPTPAP
ncbi:MAG TPA: retropepsin-like aspartic protease [Candidatus Baltobacteraceae bacterium]|nr:retropepsin-like aspartic protease [Candidatus Baltobacteraceae bacterium]